MGVRVNEFPCCVVFPDTLIGSCDEGGVWYVFRGVGCGCSKRDWSVGGASDGGGDGDVFVVDAGGNEHGVAGLDAGDGGLNGAEGGVGGMAFCCVVAGGGVDVPDAGGVREGGEDQERGDEDAVH